MTHSVDLDQTAPVVKFVSICSRRLQQMTFSDAVFLGALRVHGGWGPFSNTPGWL